MLSRAYRWMEEHRWSGDAALASLLLLVLAPAQYFSSPGDPRDVIATCALVLPQYLRRTRPEFVILVTVLGCVLQLAAMDQPLFGDLAVVLVVQAAAAHARHRAWGTAALVLALIGSVLAGRDWIGWEPPFSPSSPATVATLAGMAAVTVSYLLGLRQRDSRDRQQAELARLRERNRLLAADRDQRVELAAVAERTRIARELHDIVAHSLAVIVVQADGAAAASRTHPEIATRVLGTIADTSREALAEMRRLVAVLRTSVTDSATDTDTATAIDTDTVAGTADLTNPAYRPPPGVADLPSLVEQVQRAGIPVALRIIGTDPGLPAGTALTVYRVVQESLTNVIKHAGPGAVATVTVRFGPPGLSVDILDDGRGLAADPPDVLGAGGHGLAGMRERVALAAGTVEAGPAVGGGYLVHAVLPASPGRGTA